eukprot:scaffold147678_cov18-Tisochrysis_lutea.AAC.1
MAVGSHDSRFFEICRENYRIDTYERARSPARSTLSLSLSSLSFPVLPSWLVSRGSSQCLSRPALLSPAACNRSCNTKILFEGDACWRRWDTLGRLKERGLEEFCGGLSGAAATARGTSTPKQRGRPNREYGSLV